MRITNFWNYIEEHINQHFNDNRKGPDEVTKQQETDKEDKQHKTDQLQTTRYRVGRKDKFYQKYITLKNWKDKGNVTKGQDINDRRQGTYINDIGLNERWK